MFTIFLVIFAVVMVGNFLLMAWGKRSLSPEQAELVSQEASRCGTWGLAIFVAAGVFMSSAVTRLLTDQTWILNIFFFAIVVWLAFSSVTNYRRRCRLQLPTLFIRSFLIVDVLSTLAITAILTHTSLAIMRVWDAHPK